LETELKLLLRPEHRARLLEDLALRIAQVTPPKQRHEVTTYFDTPDLALQQVGLSLRIWQSGGQRTQTVKTEGAGDGVALRRGEWEWPIEQDVPDLSLLTQTPVDAAVLSGVEDRLEPVFVTDIRRISFDLRLDKHTTVEMVLDEGHIVAGASRETVGELELELKEGVPGALYRLARDLHAVVPLTITAESKAGRGRRLKAGTPTGARKASDPRLPSEADVAGAFRRIVEGCLGHLVSNQAAARAAVPEGVHQMRIALRRLRTAFVLFDTHLKSKAPQRFDAELQRLGRVLGEARDWDVFCGETLPAASEATPDDTWATLPEGAEAERRAAYDRLQDELDGPAVTSLVLALAAESEKEPGASALLRKSARKPLLVQAPKMLDRVARKAVKRGRGLKQRSEYEVHALRKSLKKLRYSTEFLASLYGHGAVKAYVHHCKELQQGLGAANDASVAESLAEKLSKTDPARLQVPATALARWSHAHRGRARHRSVEAWRKFKRAKPFWAARGGASN